MASHIDTYREEYKQAFKELNLEWIQTHFKVEKKDIEQLNAPEACLAEGGQIFFTVVDGRAVGTVALYNIGNGTYELAKMAVRPDYRGLKLGDKLMENAEAWARTQGADEIVILSNTVLTPAITLYKKHGYEVVSLGPHPDYERCNIEMRKVLAPTGP